MKATKIEDSSKFCIRLLKEFDSCWDKQWSFSTWQKSSENLYDRVGWLSHLVDTQLTCWFYQQTRVSCWKSNTPCWLSALEPYWKSNLVPLLKTVLSSIKCCRKPFWRKEEEDKLLQQNSTSRTVDSTFEFEIQTDWFFTIKGRYRASRWLSFSG